MPQDFANDVNIGSGNGMVPSDNKPLPEPMLTQIYVAIWHQVGSSWHAPVHVCGCVSCHGNISCMRNSPHKGPVMGCFFCDDLLAWTSCWAISQVAIVSKYYDITVMIWIFRSPGDLGAMPPTACGCAVSIPSRISWSPWCPSSVSCLIRSVF